MGHGKGRGREWWAELRREKGKEFSFFDSRIFEMKSKEI
jgi:hypothetical protein